MINIVKHKNPTPVSECGDILAPFANWDLTSTGADFYSFPDSSFYGERKFLPINAISSKVWSALEVLDIKCDTFKEEVSYECPFTENTHYHTIPIYLFSDRVDEIIDNTKQIMWKDVYKDHKWQVNMHFQDEKKFQFNSIQKAFMGAGYTHGTLPSDGSGSCEDAIVALDNGDFLGVKVWVWYNK